MLLKVLIQLVYVSFNFLPINLILPICSGLEPAPQVGGPDWKKKVLDESKLEKK